jgi:hypothetical protein
MTVWLLITILATAGLPPGAPVPGADPEFSADSLGIPGLSGSGGSSGGSLFAGFS